MQRYSLTHLSNEVLRRELSDKAAKEKEATAELLAHIAEFDARRLYLPAGYESMFAYCVGELGLSEDATKKRIRAARAGHRCPCVFEALAEGRVHLSGIVLMAAHLQPETVLELLAAAAHQTKDEIERMLVERFPRPAVAAHVEQIPAAPLELAAVEGAPGPLEAPGFEGSPGNPHARVTPLSAEAFAVQFTRSREDDELFRYLQDLLGHAVDRGDIAQVYGRAVKELVAKLERTRFAATSRPSHARRTKADSRHVPAHLKRAVWQRDEGRCTFVGESGRRCEARRGLEFDHVTEFARGGEATIDGIRLRCRGHNQFTAERTFGAGFMKHKREVAAAARSMKHRAAGDTETPEEGLTPKGGDDDVYLALRTLGYRASESRRAMALCADMAGASPGEELRRALTHFPQRCHRVERSTEATGVSTPTPA